MRPDGSTATSVREGSHSAGDLESLSLLLPGWRTSHRRIKNTGNISSELLTIVALAQRDLDPYTREVLYAYCDYTGCVLVSHANTRGMGSILVAPDMQCWLHHLTS
jgi:hypothetical protein